MTRLLALALLGAAFTFPGFTAAADKEQLASDTELLKAAGLGTDGPALIDYFKKRIVNEVDRDRIGKLINDLGNEDFDTRENASIALTTIGAPARPQLKEAEKAPDVEVARRAQLCLAAIDKVASSQFLCAAARLLAHHKPQGATEVVLAFLPSAEDAAVADELVQALAAVGFKDGQPDPAVLQALADKNPQRRGAAVEALWRSGGDEHKKAVRKLLDDTDAGVRARVALAMFDAKEKESVPVLIKLIAEAPRDAAWRVEDALYRAAGDKAPQGSITGDDSARKKYMQQWDAWYQTNGKDLDLAKIEEAEKRFGFTLIAQMELTGTAGRITELDQNGKKRWEIENLRYPICAQVLPGNDKVLVAEYTGRTVTVRTLKNEIVWTKQVTTTLRGARRLADGNTVIVTSNQILEVDKDGKEVKTVARAGNDIAAGQKLRDGGYALITTNGTFVRMDEKGKEVKSFTVGTIQSIGGSFEVLPNGRVLVPQYSTGKIVEFDADGKQVWSATATQPGCATRLPNGNTLVSSRFGRYIIEIDRNGKEVSRVTPDGRPMHVERR